MARKNERKQFDYVKSGRMENMPAGSMSGFGGRGGARWLVSGAKPKQFGQSLRRLWQHFGKERNRLTLIFLLVLLDTGIGLSGPFLIGRGIDALSARHGLVNFNLLQIVALVLLVTYVSDALLTFVQGWLMAGVSQRIVQGLRRTLFGKLQKLPIAFFDRHSHGDLMSRLSNDIDNISSTISQSTIQLMTAVLMILGSLVMMLILSPLLTLASLVTIPLVFVLTRTIAGRTRILFKEQQAILGKLNGHIEETISGIHVVKAFNHEEQVIREFDEVNGQLCRIGIKAQIWSGYIMPLMNVINNIGFAAVAGVGGVLAVNHMISIGVIASFLSYSRQFARPLNDIANTFNTLQTALAGAERVFEVFDEAEEQVDLPGAVTLKNSRGHVVFENVSFGYRPDVPILKEVSFEVRAGSSNALVGPTGAGKTTVVNLLARFYDPTGGRILIDGRDIREYTRDSLRQSFGIVLQDTYLFSGTIRDNIRYGRLDASEEEIRMAADMANADLFIRRLPRGYDTVLTESGGNLSQGQRQLLAIARAILANPAVLILDEATSNVDTRTELRIQEAMLKLMQGRTSFLIAHRLSTIRDADTIMVVSGGRIVERGSHRQLLEKKGLYYHMVFSQFVNAEGE
jgi:ATP-binding cassette subfamily B multidrug efflux pump